MGLFGRKRASCTICNKEITHKHKAKREWYVKSPLCSDCYLDKMQQSYDATITQLCVVCKIKGNKKNVGKQSMISTNRMITVSRVKKPNFFLPK